MAREIVFLALFVFAILSLLSLFQMCGVFGKGLSALLFGLLGALAYVFPVYLVVTQVCIWQMRRIKDCATRSGIVPAFTGVCADYFSGW